MLAPKHEGKIQFLQQMKQFIAGTIWKIFTHKNPRGAISL